MCTVFTTSEVMTEKFHIHKLRKRERASDVNTED